MVKRCGPVSIRMLDARCSLLATLCAQDSRLRCWGRFDVARLSDWKELLGDHVASRTFEAVHKKTRRSTHLSRPHTIASGPILGRRLAECLESTGIGSFACASVYSPNLALAWNIMPRNAESIVHTFSFDYYMRSTFVAREHAFIA